jgi:integrase
MGRNSKDGIYLPAGRVVWYCRFTDSKGKKARLSTGEKNEKKAQLVCLQMMQKADAGELSLEAENITLPQVLNLYFSGYGDNLKSRGYLYARDNLLKFFKNKKWRDICKQNGKNVLNYIKTRQKKVKPDTINKELGLLSAAANYVRQQQGIMVVNPVPGKKLKVKRFQYSWITVEQAENLIDKAKTLDKAPYLADYIIISLSTGMRLSEVLTIKKSFIDLNKGFIYLPTTKSDQPHEVPMSDQVKDSVKNLLKMSHKKSVWLFTHENGERIKSIRRGFKTACEKAGIATTDRKKGIQGFRIHDQRHTVASWLVSSGTPLADVQDLLNHENIRTTERYAHLAPENRIKTVKSLPKLTK